MTTTGKHGITPPDSGSWWLFAAWILFAVTLAGLTVWMLYGTRTI